MSSVVVPGNVVVYLFVVVDVVVSSSSADSLLICLEVVSSGVDNSLPVVSLNVQNIIYCFNVYIESLSCTHLCVIEYLLLRCHVCI